MQRLAKILNGYEEMAQKIAGIYFATFINMPNALSALEFDAFHVTIVKIGARIKTATSVNECRAYIEAMNEVMESVRLFIRKLNMPTPSLQKILVEQEKQLVSMETVTGVESPSKGSFANLFSEIDKP